MVDLEKQTTENPQNSFSGGMNLIEDDTSIGENEYRQAFNCSNRYGRLDPIYDAVEINPTITTKKQGLYNFGQYLILFSGGFAYYKHYTEDVFQIIDSFKMSANVTRMYAEFVPASTINLQRLLSNLAGLPVDEISNTNPINFTDVRIAPTPAAMLVQDGLNQPRIIYYDASIGKITSRITAKYSDWDDTVDSNKREYVPIGLDMIFIDNILIIVSPDRKCIYRSVTGRPLDFVVNVDEDGNKVSGYSTTEEPGLDELYGGADSANYAVGYDEITALNRLSNDSFLISTKTPQSYIIKINRNFKVWGEPTFDRSGEFSGSAINSFCVREILGETAIISYEGILSFNPSQTENVENKNNIFSLKISRVFQDIIQDPEKCAIGIFDDKVFFSVETVYGYVLAIYDKLRQCWSSFYNSTKGVKIKQFVSLIPNVREFYGITWDDKIFRFFTSPTTITANIATKAWNSENPKLEQKLNTLSVVVVSQQETGTVNVTPYVDAVLATSFSKTIKAKPLNNVPFDFGARPLNGFKVSYSIEWNGGGSLTHLYHTGLLNNNVNNPAQAKAYGS